MSSSDTQEGEPPLEVGDRVVLQGLVNATHLNGRHGSIASPFDSGRFGVDIDVDSQRRAIKPVNLRREVEDDDLIVVQAVNGVLPEHPHGRAASYLLDLMRVNAAYHCSDDGEITQYDLERYRASPPFGLIKIAHLTSLGWSHWITETGDGLELGGRDSEGIYEIMKLGHQQTLEQFPSQDNIPPELLFANEALESKHAAGGWHVRVHNNFWAVSESPEDGGCYLIPEGNKNMVYKVFGVRNALYPMVSRHGTRPMLYSVTLIPWFGTLLYDGVIMPAHNRSVPKQASPVLAEKLLAAVDAAVNEGRVIARLRDTQAVADAAATPARIEPNRNPPNPEETRYMEVLAALPPPVEPGNDFEVLKPWAWTFRRGGYTEEENPTHSGLVISAAGFLVGPFECSALAPTSVDILHFTVQYATQFNRQPKVLSIDERVCCDRVKFLLGETDSKIRVEYYRPPSKEESDASMAMGDMM